MQKSKYATILGAPVTPNKSAIFVCCGIRGSLQQRQELVIKLIEAGIDAMTGSVANSKMLDQFEYCEINRIKYALMLNGEFSTSKDLTLRNLQTKGETKMSFDELIDYLKNVQ